MISPVLIASGSEDETIKFWQLKEPSSSKSEGFQCVKTIKGHSFSVESLKLISKEFLASGHWNGTIKIWNLRDHSCVQTLEGHTIWVSSLDSILSN